MVYMKRTSSTNLFGLTKLFIEPFRSYTVSFLRIKVGMRVRFVGWDEVKFTENSYEMNVFFFQIRQLLAPHSYINCGCPCGYIAGSLYAMVKLIMQCTSFILILNEIHNWYFWRPHLKIGNSRNIR